MSVPSRRFRILCIASLAAWATSGYGAAPAARASAPSATPGMDLSSIDRSVAPGDDFYLYANGLWLKSVVIPPDRSDYGNDIKLVEEADRRTAELIRAVAASKPAPGSEARKIADYYASFMDEAAIEKAGVAPLNPLLARIARIRDRHELATYLGSTLRADLDVLNNTQIYTDNPFGMWVAQDLDDPSRYSAFLLQGGLGMPDREYYLDESPVMKRNRDKYVAHIGRMFALAGLHVAPGTPQRILDLERRIAAVHATRAETIQVRNGDNHWPRAEFASRAPGLDWDAYFAAAGLAREAQIVVWHPKATSGISALLAHEPLELVRDYLTLHALDRYGGLLPRRFVEERFDFFGRTLTGTPSLRARWKRGVTLTNGALGDALGKLYAERWFPPSEKARAQEMVKNLIAAFSQRIDRLDWMTPETRSRAKEKLAALRVGVGYPDTWRDYAALRVVRGDALGNFMRAEQFQTAWSLGKLGRPVDRSEWVMTPQTVNAVNLPALNALNFPAAILQPPYFDPRQPEAMDYGAIGAVIGHEISHSFDDQGALFDAQGRLHNWWQPDDFKHFELSGNRLAEQYSAYRPFPDLAINGRQTLSENIADVAGLAAAYDAFEHSRARASAPVVDGLTPEQQFFVAFAQSWRDKMREPYLREIVLSDGHSPGQYRAYTARNLDAWYEAFGIKPGAKLYLAPEARVRVW